eukprot:11489367-Karenia_brevis.AAC.1
MNSAARIRYYNSCKPLCDRLSSLLYRSYEKCTVKNYGENFISPKCWLWPPIVLQLEEHARLGWIKGRNKESFKAGVQGVLSGGTHKVQGALTRVLLPYLHPPP